MFCHQCEVSLPDDALFCYNCGLVFDSIATSISSQDSPEYLHTVHVFREGKTTKGLLGGERHGFAVLITLRDSKGHNVASDGILTIELGNEWRGKIAVKKQEFSSFKVWKDVAAGIDTFGYSYLHIAPDVRAGASGKIKAWFQTPNGKKLYKSKTFSL